MNKFIPILFFLVFSVNTAQHSDTQAAIYNVASSAAIGGFGAVINKDKDESFFRAFINGSWQGALGGYLVFESKRLIRDFSVKNDYAYVWPSRLINSAGNSIILNGASNNRFGQKWYFNFGFNHIEYDLTQERRLKYRIMPFAMYGTVSGFTRGSLDLKNTLKTGIFTFKGKNHSKESFANVAVNTIIYWEGIPPEDLYKIIGHEIIHAYQYEGLIGSNAFYNKIQRNLEANNQFFNKYNSVFYTDLNHVPLQLMHEYDALYIPYEKRKVEREAFYFDGSKKN